MSIEFSRAASLPQHFPDDGLPEIAFVGRSNVGKSSLLNTLVLRGKRRDGPQPIKKNLARTSSTPGRTQSINFYRINDETYFVDLPGYGYAKAPKAAMDEWKLLAEAYLTDREPLALVVLIIDIRHGPTVLDRQMRTWLEANAIPTLVVGAKADKLKRTQLAKAVRAAAEEFDSPTAFSAETGVGVGAVWDGIRSALADRIR